MSFFHAAKRPRTDGLDNGTLLDNIEKLYLSEKTADVTFVFDSGDTRVSAHKNLLAATSDVFEVMFYGAVKEKDEVELKDVSAAAFIEFLQFFYKANVELTSTNIGEVMHLGHKYNVAKCFDECVQFYETNLIESYTCFGIELAILYDHRELLKTCERLIIAAPLHFFQTADFLKCKKRVLKHILNMNLLSCSESDIFEACMSWVRAKSQQGLLSKAVVQQHLGELFYDIRFASMTLQELTHLMASYDAVLTDDFKDLAKMIAIPDFHVSKFKRNRRQIYWRKDDVIKCNRVTNKQCEEFDVKIVSLKAENVTEFFTNESIVLGGFVCAQIIGLVDEHFPVDVEIVEIVELDISEISSDSSRSSDSSFDDRQLNTLLSFKANIQKTKETDICLPKPILIRPYCNYEIRIKHFLSNYCIHTKEMQKEMQINPDITINFIRNEDEELVKILMFNFI